jgi:hypothetical protein
MVRRMTATAVVFASFLVIGCGDSGLVEADVPADLVASWTATSLLWGGQDLILSGTTLTLTFRSDGSFLGVATNSPNRLFCDETPDCQINADYSATSTQLVFSTNEPLENQVSMSMSVDATTLLLSGPIEGQDGVFTFSRSP